MDKIKNTLKGLWRDESGQGATEYILILVVVVAIVFAFKDAIVTKIKELTNQTGDKLKGSVDGLSK